MSISFTDRFNLPSFGTPPTVFTLTFLPIAGTLEVFRNGILQYPSADYTASGQTVTLNVTALNDLIQFPYLYNPPGPVLSGALVVAQDYIYQAFRKCGQMRPGYTPSPELLADALIEFQVLFDNFNAERTMAYSMPDYVYNVTGTGHGTTGNGQTFGGSGFQIGPTALDFVGPRPESIVRMNLYYTSSPGTPARIPLRQISMEEWLSIPAVVFQATNVATVFAYDPQFPNGVIWVWPPLNGNALEIFTWGFLTPPASLSTAISLPPGYADCLLWTLAEKLWPLCTQDIMIHKLNLQYVCGQKAQAQARVRRVNAPMPRLANDFRGGRNTNGAVSDWALLFAGV